MTDKTFQTVTEAQANAATRNIYSDIRSNMGVALVNLPSTDTVAPLSKSDQQWLIQALNLFINGIISRGVVIVPAMRSLPGNHN